MELTPDDLVAWAWGPWRLNATVIATWAVMALLVLGSCWATRRLRHDGPIPRWQHVLEAVVDALRGQIVDATRRSPGAFLPFIGTLFLFIATCNVLAVVPGFPPPTASLSTTAALALCVFAAVPVYGFAHRGIGGYLRLYLQPSPLMLPFNLIGELSRTLALAMRCFGNAMSSVKIGAVLLLVAPLVLPVAMHALGLLTGLIQAYIFAILALVYIASACGTEADRPPSPKGSNHG